MSLDLLELRNANVKRCLESFKHSLDDWSEMEWGCAAAGEMGELCNLLKKRGRGEKIPLKSVMDEIADVIIYLDLLAAKLGLQLSGPIREKFNEVSHRKGSNIKL
jgi:NTP pyrophosphatase (non-canonical NTP hydrolase)